jgi:hypothetical protein
MKARRKLLGVQSQENAPLRKLPAEGSHVNMAVGKMLPENHGSLSRNKCKYVDNCDLVELIDYKERRDS